MPQLVQVYLHFIYYFIQMNSIKLVIMPSEQDLQREYQVRVLSLSLVAAISFLAFIYILCAVVEMRKLDPFSFK